MSSSEIVRQKKRGRPRIGQLPVVSFRMDPVVQEEIDQWRSLEPDKPSRSKATKIIAYSDNCRHTLKGLPCAGRGVGERTRKAGFP